MELNDVAVVDDGPEQGEEGNGKSNEGFRAQGKSPPTKTRSLSDGEGMGGCKLSPSPLILGATRRTSKDDSYHTVTPVTPRRPDISLRGLALSMPPRDVSPPRPTTTVRTPAPLSPKLEHSQIYASPTSALPRRSRGLDFSRAATSLHHSTLAEQSSPESSPIIGGKGMNIPDRRPAELAAAETTNSLWSMMGNQERMNISTSLGSTNHMLGSEISSSSDEDDLMDEDEEMSYITTPQVSKMSAALVGPLSGGSPAANSLLSFQQRQRPRKNKKRRHRAHMAGTSLFGASSSAPPNNQSKSPPTISTLPHARRESISWAANQLHISGNDSDENPKAMEGAESQVPTPGRDGHRVVRRVVHRRQNLLPKTKGFARIRAALLEESAPLESEVRREAEVVRQVLESDMDLEPRIPAAFSGPNSATTSPNMPLQDSIDEMGDEPMMSEAGPGFPSSFHQQAVKNSKGKNFWDTFSESSSIATSRTSPPPPPFSMPRGSSSGMSLEDVNMDYTGGPSSAVVPTGGVFPMTTSSSGGETPQLGQINTQQQPPSAAEITRRINTKRRRDDDLDPGSFKRRAVSPGLSVHNSPVMQSPMQRPDMPWGPSRPGSNGNNGERAGSVSTASEVGSQGPNAPNTARPGGGGKGRVGFQGMVDTNDGITRLSIE